MSMRTTMLAVLVVLLAGPAPATAAGGPFEPVEGFRFAAIPTSNGGAEDQYLRLTKVVDLTTASSAQLRFMLSADTEPGYDHVLVEAHTLGQDNWTTLADLNGASSTAPPAECRQPQLVADVHPFLAHYFSGTQCDAPGTSGVWNSFTGSTGGWREVAFDLSSLVGGQAELSIAFVSDPAASGAGVFVDDTRIVVNGALSSADGFEGVAGSWSPAGPPAGSPANRINWVIVGPLPTTTAVAASANPSLTDDEVTFSATVVAEAGTPGGTVQFRDGAVDIGAPAALSGGVASRTVSGLTSGSHDITAVYSGNADFGPSTGTLTQVATNIADLSVTNGCTPASVKPNAIVACTLTVANAGPATARGIELTDMLPVFTTFESLAAPTGWACSTPPPGTRGVVSCSIAATALASHVFVLALRVAAAAPPGPLANTAGVTSPSPDPDAADRSATSVVNVVPAVVCRSARRFTLTLRSGSTRQAGLRIKRPLRGARITAARLTGPPGIASRAPRHTRRTVRVDLRALPKGHYALRVTVRRGDDKIVHLNRVYDVCSQA